MKRTKLKDRNLPDYTRGEEIFNMVSHIAGGAFGIVALVTCVIKAFLNHDAYQVVSACIYGFSMIILYTMSSVYHGLIPETAKKVMQVLDHCTIFILIAGTYTPVALCSLRSSNTAFGWTVFGIVWGVSALGITLNAIDLKKYSLFSNICYLLLGWCIVFTGKPAINAIAYTVGAVLYGIAGRSVHRYMHSVFHIFVVIGSILHYICIICYIFIK